MDWYKSQPPIPLNTINQLENYVIKGDRPSGFLSAVLKNNLFSSFALADEYNKPAMSTLVTFINSKCPSGCYGGPNAVDSWIDRGGLEDLGHSDDPYFPQLFQQYREEVLTTK